MKYAANSAAKNISSLESQMMVPTATMLGRSWCPWRREAGIVAVVATRSLCPAHQARPPPPRMSSCHSGLSGWMSSSVICKK